MKREKKHKTKEQLSPEMVIKMCEICPERWGRLVGRIYGKGKLLSLEWNRDGVMHSESDDDDELMSERWNDSNRDSLSTGLQSYLGSSFQRRGEAWQKEWLLTVWLEVV